MVVWAMQAEFRNAGLLVGCTLPLLPLQSKKTPTTTTSPEAAWQYLGNVPYRRILIYSHVRWEYNNIATTVELMSAKVCGDSGVVAVLTTQQDAAVVEFMDAFDAAGDSHDSYIREIPSSARWIWGPPSNVVGRHQNARFPPISPPHSSTNSSTEWPPHYAVITILPTAMYATTHTLQYTGALAVLPKSRTASRHPELFLATHDNSVLSVRLIHTTNQLPQIVDVDCRHRMAAPILDMCFAPNGRFLACYTENSMLTVVSASFDTKVLDFDTSEGSQSVPPLSLQWCGEDSVVLHWKNLGLLMVGPYRDWLRFPYHNHTQQHHVVIGPEMDGCRVVTDTTVEVLQRVPPTTAQLLRIGSIDTAAMLLDAADAHYQHHHQQQGSSTTTAKTTHWDAIFSEPSALRAAIDTCTDAATKEFDIPTQKRLLRAASFGLHSSFKKSQGDNGGPSLIGGPTTTMTAYSTPGDVDNEEEEDQFGILPSRAAQRFVQAARTLRI